MMSVSLDRKGASDHGNPARGLFLDNDEYWERPDPTPQAVPGFPSVQRQEIEPQVIAGLDF